MKNNRLRKIDFFKVFLRSFFMQSVWNYRSLISVGFEVCLIPIVKRLYPDYQSRKEFLLRHLKFFNSHPYMASYALGVSMKLEEEIATGNPDIAPQLEKVKELMTGPLGRKGDQLFWLTIKPFSLIIGVLGLFVFDSAGVKVAVLAISFLIYNIPHFYLRYVGLVEGYEYGLNVYKRINVNWFDKLRRIYLYTGIAAFSIFFLMLVWHLFEESQAQLIVLILAGLYAGLTYKLSRKFYFTIFFTLVLFIIVGFLLF
ncbi:MAG: PTS system mannose/fructose/sorbose family transporter subunit IID [Calditrichia bacterium]